MSKSKTTEAAAPSSVITPAVAELIALGAAMGANCEPCLKYHYSQARKLGLSREDMAAAVELADRVKRAPAENMRALADKLLKTRLATEPPVDPHPGSCCSAKTAKSPPRRR